MLNLLTTERNRSIPWDESTDRFHPATLGVSSRREEAV